MRILLSIHHALDPDAGAPSAVLSLAAALRGLGHDAGVLGLPPGRGMVRRSAPGFAIACDRAFARAAPGLDVIDASTGDAWLYGRRRRSDRPILVTHSHGLEHRMHRRLMDDVRQGRARTSWRYPLYNGSLRLWEVARSLRVADLCLFLNAADRDHAVGALRVAADRCRVVANGVDDRLLDREPAWSIPGPGALRVAHLGDWSSRKGMQDSTLALTRLLRRFPAASAAILGAGCEPCAVLSAFDDDLHGRVDVSRRYARADLPALIGDAHVLLMPSRSEGSPLVLGEAMACGLAPVAAAIPGVVGRVTDGVDGLLVPAGDGEALAASLALLVEQPALLASLRRAARRRALGWGWADVARTRVALYEEALARRAADRAGMPR